MRSLHSYLLSAPRQIRYFPGHPMNSTSILRSHPIVIIIGLFLSLLEMSAAPTGTERPTIDLTGEWEFRRDARDQGVEQKWYLPGTTYPDQIHVPGAWNAQGFGFESASDLAAYQPQLQRNAIAGPGTETNRLFHVFPGPAWYRRTVIVPPEWEHSRAWLNFGGVHRKADVWVNGHPVRSHVGYLVPFRVDVTPWIRFGATNSLVVRVDARRDPGTDPLMGCLDTLDFLFVQWGGIHRGVQLESTADRWVENVFVVPKLSASSAEVQVTLGMLEKTRPETDRLRVEAFDQEQRLITEQNLGLQPGATTAVTTVFLPGARLWTPENPHLYQVRVSLLRNGRPFDALRTRFGMREFKVEDGRFLLNGNPIFLRGYGDDCIYPETVAPPVDREEYRSRFRVIKEYGFNYARHHSWCPSEEYLDIADEMGVMLQPEFPHAYRWELPQSPQTRALAISLWRQMILTHRNHPSIVTWCMGNELYDGFPDAPEMYQIAKQLDPTRLVIDSDGVSRNKPRDTLDFWVWQFSEGSLGFRNTKYDFPKPEKPVVAHEMGYFVTLPDLTQGSLFKSGLRPYWIYETRELAEMKGLLDVYPKWLKSSYQLQAECLKINMESARRSRLQGYSCWLFQDYPWCAEGVVDMFFRSKAFSGVQFRQFNGPSVLLLDRDDRSFRTGDSVEFRLLGASELPLGTTIARTAWSIRDADNRIIASNIQTNAREATLHATEVASIRFQIPAASTALPLLLEVQGQFGQSVVSNQWKLWAFPEPPPVPTSVTVDLTAALQGLVRQDGTAPLSSDRSRLLITDQWRDNELRFLQEGGRVLLLSPENVLPTVTADFRPAGWDPSSREANLGTIFDPDHPALSTIPSQGWCDVQFYSLIQGGRVVLLDELDPGLSPIVRCIDMPQRLWNKAFLFEARVGAGSLLVSGFNFAGALKARDPAATYIAHALIRYASGDDFKPRANLSPERLKAGQSSR